MPNVDVNITDSEGFVQTATTDANGDYDFSSVTVGSTTVTIDESTLPAGYVPIEGTNPTTVDVLVASEAEIVNGYQQQVRSILGSVYSDLNGDGMRGADSFGNEEPGLPNVVVRADSSCPPGTGVVQTTVTDVNGDYVFSSVPVGSTIVTIDESTLPADTVALTEGTNPTTVNVPADGSATIVNGYLQRAGFISGVIFDDTDGDGMGAGEPGLAGVVVIVTDERGDTLTTVTDANGEYFLEVFPEGVTTVSIDENTLPAGYVLTDGTNPTTLFVACCNSLEEIINGYQYQDGLIGGFIYEDTNGDGVRDLGEPGLAGVDVTITDSGGIVQTTTTAADGSWGGGISPVPVGSTTVDIDESTLPAGYVLTDGTNPTTVIVSTAVFPSVVNGYSPPLPTPPPTPPPTPLVSLCSLVNRS